MKLLDTYGAGQVFLRPASEGTGVIAGGAIRDVLELAGINDILSKCLGSRTPINMVRATMTALKELKQSKKLLSSVVKNQKKFAVNRRNLT